MLVRATLGDRVEVEFTGDQLPASRRRSLVPIEQLRSVDEEVIEDASRNIEQYLRLEGYRLAEAPAVRRRDTGLLTITFNVRRGPLHELESLNVDGVAQIPLEEVEGLLKLQAGEAYVDARVATVAAALAELYRVRGFAAVRVSPRVTTGALAEGRVPVRVRLEVAEGPHTSVTEVSFEGATALTPTELLESVALVTGKPYYRPQQTIDRAAIERRYRNLGYQRAVIEVRETPTEDAAGVAITYVVREGPQTRVDHVLVSGTERISPDVVRREVALQPGQPLGYDALLESQQRLSALGLFRRVRITEAPYGAEDAVRDVLVEVEEAPATTATYGVGVEMGQLAATGEGGAVEDRIYAAPRGFFEITRRNLWGKNRSLSLLTSVSLRPTEPGVNVNTTAAQWQYGFNQYRLVGTFREPRAFNTVGDAQLSAYVERGVRSSFNFNRRGVRADYARRFPNRLVALGRYAYEHTELFDTKISIADQPLVDRLFPQVRLSTIFGSLIRDTRNDIIDPEQGSVVGGELDTALRVLGSEVGFVKGFAQAFLYRKLPGTRPFVVAAGARLGLARAFQQENLPIDPSLPPPDGEPSVEVLTNLLPASERFFAGGDTTVRGFALDRLGTEETLNAFGFPTGGNAMLVANLELRTPYVKGVAVVGFVDAGNVFLRASDLDLTEIRTAAGFGIRYRSPLGPLRVDVGFKLDRQELIPGVERRVVYHLSIGQAFWTRVGGAAAHSTGRPVVTMERPRRSAPAASGCPCSCALAAVARAGDGPGTAGRTHRRDRRRGGDHVVGRADRARPRPGRDQRRRRRAGSDRPAGRSGADPAGSVEVRPGRAAVDRGGRATGGVDHPGGIPGGARRHPGPRRVLRGPARRLGA